MSRALKQAVLALLLSLSVAAVASAVTFYSQDEAHLWNRLHTALVVRTSVDGVVEDDLLDPPLWRETKHLLAGESNRQAVTLLGKFSRDRDSLATRTLLQRGPLPNVDRGPWINPQTLQLPVGSMWALVRLAVLVAPDGTPFVSPLVESVQIRVSREIAAGAQRAQRFFEWEMRPALLLSWMMGEP
jgi:hypothetical protein